MASWILATQVAQWSTFIFVTLDARTQPRMIPLLVGALFTQGRSTVSRWIAAAGVGADFRRYYYALGSLGRKTPSVATMIWHVIQRVVPLPPRIVLALDDTLTKRRGPKVEGAGVHHNPPPGPADANLALWTRMGHDRPGVAASTVGTDRPATVVEVVCPSEGSGEGPSGVPLELSDQTGTGGRVGGVVCGAAVQPSASAVGGC